MSRTALKSRIVAIEKGYEFLLAFAAQGVRDDRDSPSGGQLRDTLASMADAMAEIAPALGDILRADALLPTEAWEEIRAVLARDAAAALAALRLVHARAGISSQVIDNLNASVHLRALLTDLFLIDDLLDDAQH